MSFKVTIAMQISFKNTHIRSPHTTLQVRFLENYLLTNKKHTPRHISDERAANGGCQALSLSRDAKDTFHTLEP